MKTGLYIGFAILYGAASMAVHGAVRTQQHMELDDKGITTAINTELLYDDYVTANNVDVATKEGVVSLTGKVKSMGVKERAQQLAAAIKGVRSIINRIEVEPVGYAVPDNELTQRVRSALENDPATDAFELEVSTVGGMVTLAGTVESFAEKQLSASVAKRIGGVVGLKNNIEVEYATERADSEIAADVLARLKNDIRVDANLISVHVNEGSVQLSGTVGSNQEHGQAYADAWVAGVQEVDTDQLDVEWWAREHMRLTPANALRPDPEILDAVTSALRHDPRVEHESVNVTMKHGVATLSGHVDNVRAREAAEADARNTLGVRRVLSQIKVRPEIPDDQTLENRISEMLKVGGLVDRSDLKIQINNGLVTLEGEVETSFEKAEAVQMLSAVKGVIGVRDKIRYERIWSWQPDRDLKESVQYQLEWDVFINSDRITVSVQHGTVTLTGTVTAWSEYDDAEKNAYQAGAKHVINKLDVEEPDHQGAYGPSFQNPFYMGGYYIP